MTKDGFREWLLGPIHQRLNHLEERVMSAVTDLQDAVKASDTVIESALTLIEGFADQLKAAGTDPVALQALHDDVKAHSDALAAAVAANTAAEPTPAPVPAPTDSPTP